MLISGQLLLEDATASPAGRCRIAPGTLRVRDDRIEEVIEGELAAAADWGGPDCLIVPGLIDTHLHLPQFDIIGAHGLPLLQWLDQVTFPAELSWADTDHARAAASRAFDQCLRHGTTGICAYATVHHEATAAALRLASDRGLRGVIGQVLMDREAPSGLCRSADRSIAESADLLSRFPPGSRIAAAVTPRFAPTCSDELLARAGRLAAETGAVVQTHLAETVAECERVSVLFGGRDYAQVYADAGLLGPRTVCAHGIHLDPGSRRRLAASGTRIAHCPVANSFLRSGTMLRHELLDAGVAVTLGSDIGAGYERSMVRVGRAMIEAAAGLGGPVPAAATAWHAITAGNATAIGWDDAGRLAAGAMADLLIIRPDIDWLGLPIDPLARLMFAWDDRWIIRRFLRGQTIN